MSNLSNMVKPPKPKLYTVTDTVVIDGDSGITYINNDGVLSEPNNGKTLLYVTYQLYTDGSWNAFKSIEPSTPSVFKEYIKLNIMILTKSKYLFDVIGKDTIFNIKFKDSDKLIGVFLCHDNLERSFFMMDSDMYVTHELQSSSELTEEDLAYLGWVGV